VVRPRQRRTRKRSRTANKQTAHLATTKREKFYLLFERWETLNLWEWIKMKYQTSKRASEQKTLLDYPLEKDRKVVLCGGASSRNERPRQKNHHKKLALRLEAHILWQISIKAGPFYKKEKSLILMQRYSFLSLVEWSQLVVWCGTGSGKGNVGAAPETRKLLILNYS